MACLKHYALIGLAFFFAAPPSYAQSLRVQVVEGQNAINNISRNTAYEPVIEVRDASGSPVEGASVSFVLPNVGPGALFADGNRTLIVQTDAAGRAKGRGLRPNNQIGQFEIRVIAAHLGERATTTVNQTNAAPVVASSGSGKKLALVLGLDGGGAAAVLAAVAGGGGEAGGPSSAVPISGTITPGAPGFGPPR